MIFARGDSGSKIKRFETSRCVRPTLGATAQWTLKVRIPNFVSKHPMLGLAMLVIVVLGVCYFWFAREMRLRALEQGVYFRLKASYTIKDSGEKIDFDYVVSCEERRRDIGMEARQLTTSVCIR